MFKAKEA